MTRQQIPTKELLKIEYIAINALVPDPKNARKHTKKQISQLMAGISEFGFTNPILTDEKLFVIAGHARLEAALGLGMANVPCVRLYGLTEPQKQALAIADNKLGDMSEFDLDLLSATLTELSELDFSVELTGFDTAEIDVLLASTSTVSKVDPADALPPEDPYVPTVTLTGDLWLLGPHRLLCANALEASSFEALLGADRADLVFCDMPYNVPIAGHVSGLGKARHREFAMASGEMTAPEFTQFLTTAMSLMARFSADGSIHYQCMDHRHSAEMLAAGAAAYTEYKNLCVWDKGSGGMGSLYRSRHELVFVFKNGTAPHINNVQLGRFGRYRTNVWSYPGLNSFGKSRDSDLADHPTVKPTALVADAIRDCSKRGALVLDPFAGSGTTIMAAERTGRRAAAMEIDPRYVDTAVRRWQAVSGKQATLAGDGKTYAEVAAERAAASTPIVEKGL